MPLAFVLALAGACLPATAAEPPRVTVELERSRIYEGESVLYLVTVENTENPSPPRLEGFEADFEVESLGDRSIDSQSVVIINGVREETIRRGRQYQFRLTPRRSGSFEIPAPVTTVDGVLVRGRKVPLEVVGQTQQDLAILTISSDRDWVYPTQPFTVTLTVAVKPLPEPMAAAHPLAVIRPQTRQRDLLAPQRQIPAPHLQISWMDDRQLPRGVQPEMDPIQTLMPLQSSTLAGFTLNNVTRKTALSFSIFDEERAIFQPPPQRVKRADAAGKQLDYWEFRFSRSFTANKFGKHSFGPATLKGLFVRTINEQRRALVQDVYVLARPIAVEVRDAPLEGRPDTYIGAAGTGFRVSGELRPTRAIVGNPMTFTLSVSGSGSLESTQPPDLALMPEIADNFKVYDATQQTTGDTREFTFTLRPKTTEIDRFPAVPVSYFDVDRGKYQTLQTRPVSIEITPAEQLSADDIAMSSGAGAVGREGIQARSEGIFANVTDLGSVYDQSVRPGRWLVALVGLLGIYAVVAVVSHQIQRLSADEAGRRRRAAPANARQRLQAGLDALNSHNLRAGADQVQTAVTGLVADVNDLPESGLTPRDVREQLSAQNVDQALIERVDDLLQSCDAARYGSLDAAGALGPQARQTLDDLIAALKQQKRFR
jgi:hypothetical protein